MFSLWLADPPEDYLLISYLKGEGFLPDYILVLHAVTTSQFCQRWELHLQTPAEVEEGPWGGGGKLGADLLSNRGGAGATGPGHLPSLPSSFLVNSLGYICLVPHIPMHCLEYRFLRLTQLAIFHWSSSWPQIFYSFYPHLFRTSEKIFRLKSHFINVLGKLQKQMEYALYHLNL